VEEAVNQGVGNYVLDLAVFAFYHAPLHSEMSLIFEQQQISNG